MVTQSAGFRHGSVTRKEPAAQAPAEMALTNLGVSSGLFRVDCTQDVATDLTKDRLDAYDIVFFYTTGNLPIEPTVREYLFTDWVKQKGHGFIGTHSATDTFKESRALLGNDRRDVRRPSLGLGRDRDDHRA